MSEIQERIYKPYVFGIEIKLSNGDILNIDYDGFLIGNKTRGDIFNSVPEVNVHEEMKKRLSNFFKDNDTFEVDTSPGVNYMCSQVVSYEVY